MSSGSGSAGQPAGGWVAWYGHSTSEVALGGQRLLLDPVLRARVGPLRWKGSPPDAGLARRATAVLVSHQHRDHLDLPSLAGVRPEVLLIVPRGAARLLSGRVSCRVHEVDAYDELSVGEVTVRAVPAHHDGRRWPAGPPSPALGFLLRGPQGCVFYAGDTGQSAVFDELRAAGVDVALLPVGGWGPTLGEHHLDPRQAAGALAQLRPVRAIPVHWGDLRLPVAWRLRHPRGADPRIAFAAAARSLAPGVDVVLPTKGQPVALLGNGGLRAASALA